MNRRKFNQALVALAVIPMFVEAGVKRCQDCKWGRLISDSDSWHWAKCTNPITTEGKPITTEGKEPYWHLGSDEVNLSLKDYPYTERMRKSYGRCGPSARLFEPKELSDE